MSDAVLLTFALLTAVIGMAGFAAANDLHWRQLFPKRRQSTAARTLCRTSGTTLLAISFGLCAMADPVSMAFLVWPMLLGVAAAVVAAALTIRGRASRR
ncbi:hypothetical protein SLG_10830 [Sphingobium sp. SYK-6]|uniref:DUF3325 family protein n=1 Tax=Sphingobium sp. (strain NBRC 103272 / SYK-6) TaxID=627192 RepID=UPI00022766FD|nr:DUF3325 family protein [Sphingobium sp. SYK-6]BAK65758.1 hypothetical protein SLG_10830 [Sphingobium sp. SYK-6]